MVNKLKIHHNHSGKVPSQSDSAHLPEPAKESPNASEWEPSFKIDVLSEGSRQSRSNTSQYIVKDSVRSNYAGIS